MKRVVTGVDGQGRSHVVSIDELDPSGQGLVVWEYRPADVLEWIRAIDPDAAATWIEPEVDGGLKMYLGAFAPDTGQPAPPMPNMDEHGFHTTRTIDFVYLVSGELVLLLDDDVRVPLKQGDVVIQQATRHSWKNEGDADAVILGLLHRPAGI